MTQSNVCCFSMPLGNSIPPWAPMAHQTWPGAKVMAPLLVHPQTLSPGAFQLYRMFISSIFSCPTDSLFMTYPICFSTEVESCHFRSLIDRPYHFVGPRNWSNPNMSNTPPLTCTLFSNILIITVTALSPLALSCSISANLLIARKATPCAAHTQDPRPALHKEARAISIFQCWGKNQHAQPFEIFIWIVRAETGVNLI